jgi:hypothetical protein
MLRCGELSTARPQVAGLPSSVRGKITDVPPSWEESLLSLFDDLEQQAEGLHLEERRHEVEALASADFAEVSLESRLLGSLGTDLVVRLAGGLLVRGVLLRAGSGWLLLRDEHDAPWLSPAGAVLSVAGLSGRSAAPEARTVQARHGLASAQRALATEGGECVIHLHDGQRLEGRLGRVGADFVELAAVTGLQLVPTGAIAAVQGRR